MRHLLRVFRAAGLHFASAGDRGAGYTDCVIHGVITESKSDDFCFICDPTVGIVRLALRHVPRFNTGMPDTRIDFSAPAELRKWPSVNKQRVSASLGARPYLMGDCVTLDECIAWFMLLPESQHHLYEIHTAPQADLVSAILSTEHIVELARLRDCFGK